MPRVVTLFTGQWADLPLEDLCRKASDFGYQGLELACWGDHFEVDRAVDDPNYASAKRDLLDRHDLECHAISSHLVGQAVCDRIDQRHRAILPPHVWGDGDPSGVNRRAAEDMKNTARAAQQMGVGVVNGFTGSSIWPLLYSFPPVPESMIEEGFRQFAERWNPILDVFGECGVRFALEVHPTEIAFDLEPFAVAGCRPGRIHSRVSRSHLSRPRQRRDRNPERPERHIGEPPQFRRPTAGVGLPFSGARRREFRGDPPRAESGTASMAPARRASS
jgi:sugar phosphate isomerase/epimerase